MKEKLQALVEGRNGLDMWNYIIIVVDVLLIVVSILANSYLPLVIAFLLIVLFLFRALSRNLERRRKENRFFADTSLALVRQHKLNAMRWKDRRTTSTRSAPPAGKSCGSNGARAGRTSTVRTVTTTSRSSSTSKAISTGKRPMPARRRPRQTRNNPLGE